ncbi:SDR family NAD(P)-dependent oxidoreductase [Fluviicola sp.]|uniref:SDR family NAD(P)-dependent oxidoreductase n=1 Tax=Fluviicola sp. TaxID=1917219 RepID=UPI0031DFE51F
MNYTLITGASGGIGEAAAKAFAAKKHNLVLVSRSEQKLKDLCEQLSGSYGIKAEYIAADLSHEEAPAAIYKACFERHLTVNVLINNAGIGSSGDFTDNALQSELDIIRINCSSLTALTHLFLADMKKRRSGRIVNIGSLISFIASPYMSVYAASKHFVKIFTYSLAEESKLYGVDVLFFSPGLTASNFMNTQANDNAWGKALTEGANTQTPEQVAGELIQAFDRKKAFHVSGSSNRRAAFLAGLFPLRTIARVFARRKQKEMGLLRS